MVRILALWMVLTVAAGCATLPPTPQDVQAKQFEKAPGRAVVYLVRTRPDLSFLPATIMLDGQMIGTTHEGTYFRWELAPGRHRISGYASDNGEITIDVQADRLYFVQQTVLGGPRVRNGWSSFRLINETQGRDAVFRGSRV
jgi:hypothetical protein